MTAARTPSQRGRANRAKGHQAERDLARWLRSNGYPNAERAGEVAFRAPDRAVSDPLDIKGTPCLWSVKACATERLDVWMGDLRTAPSDGPCPRLLVVRRPGHADPARWWCWQELLQVVTLASASLGHDPPVVPFGVWTEPVRMELGHVVPLLRAAGYGEPLAD